MSDTSWINVIDRDIARDAVRVLDEIVAEMDLLKDPIVIWPYIPNMGTGQEENVRGWKMNILEMLRKRGVLKSAEYRYERLPGGGGEGIWIEADEASVRETRRLLRDRIRGPARPYRSTAPRPVTPVPTAAPVTPAPGVAPAPPAPPAPDPLTDEIRKTHRIERVKFWYVVGAGVAVALILALIFGGWKWAVERFKPKNPAAAESTGVGVSAFPTRPAPAGSSGSKRGGHEEERPKLFALLGPIHTYRSQAGGTDLWTLVTLSNHGESSYAQGWTIDLTGKNFKLHLPSTVIPGTGIAYRDEDGIADYYWAREAIYVKAHKPIQRGSPPVVGWLFCQNVPLTQARLSEPGTRLKVSFLDAYGNPYSQTYIMQGAGRLHDNMDYVPGTDWIYSTPDSLRPRVFP